MLDADGNVDPGSGLCLDHEAEVVGRVLQPLADHVPDVDVDPASGILKQLDLRGLFSNHYDLIVERSSVLYLCRPRLLEEGVACLVDGNVVSVNPGIEVIRVGCWG